MLELSNLLEIGCFLEIYSNLLEIESLERAFIGFSFPIHITILYDKHHHLHFTEETEGKEPCLRSQC